MTRILSIVVIIWLLALGAAAGARAQAATPAPDQLFAGLGLPELILTATPERLTLSQYRIPAGRYLVILDDQSGGEPFPPFIEFLRLGPGDPTTSDRHCFDGMEPHCFAWYPGVYLPGGVSVESPRVILELKAGEYGLWGAWQLMDPEVPLLVTDDPDVAVIGPAPDGAAITITPDAATEGYAFRVEGKLRPGRQLVRVVNAADRPFFVFGGQYSGPITAGAVATMESIVMHGGVAPDGGTPPPGALDPDRFRDVGSAITQSPGTQQWIVLDLEPGQLYLAGYYPVPFTIKTGDSKLGATVVVPVAGA